MVARSTQLLSATLKLIKSRNAHINLLTTHTLAKETIPEDTKPSVDNVHFSENFMKNDSERKLFVRDMLIYENFITEAEENELFQEVEPYLRRMHYEFDHWDDAIHGFRETERLQWNENNSKTLQRLRNLAFPPGCAQLAHVHVLDLAPTGLIKPHIDAVRFCGNTIAGISLLSDSVMRLIHDKNKQLIANVILKRRSLYIMKDTVRYEYTHEILGEKESKFCEQNVPRERRISIICRNEPDTDK